MKQEVVELVETTASRAAETTSMSPVVELVETTASRAAETTSMKPVVELVETIRIEKEKYPQNASRTNEGYRIS